MPNYVSNRISIIGSDDAVKRVAEFVKSDYGVFDFEKILPMPEELNIDCSSIGDWGMEYILAERVKEDMRTERENEIIEKIDKRSDKAGCIALGQKYLDNLAKYGATTWYDWHRQNWGTKWNACGPVYDGDGNYFLDTAWNAPLPVLRELSRQFPEVEIAFVYADEDCSYNTGEGTFNKGEMYADFPEGDSEDGWRLYFEVHEWARDEMHKDENGKWVWNEN